MSGENKEHGSGQGGKSAEDIAKIEEQLKAENFQTREKLRLANAEIERLKSEGGKSAQTHEQRATALEQQLAQERADREKLDSEIAEGKKNGVLTAELFKLGIRPEVSGEALKMIDRSKIYFDKTTQTVIGAEGIAKDFLKQATEKGLGFFTGENVSVNQGGVINKGGAVTSTAGMTREERIAHWTAVKEGRIKKT
jgi:uncharacterized protein YdaT